MTGVETQIEGNGEGPKQVTLGHVKKVIRVTGSHAVHKPSCSVIQSDLTKRAKKRMTPEVAREWGLRDCATCGGTR